MEEAPENGMELLHSAHANGMNEWRQEEIGKKSEVKCQHVQAVLRSHEFTLGVGLFYFRCRTFLL